MIRPRGSRTARAWSSSPLFFSSATSTPAGAVRRLAPRWNSDANASKRAGGCEAVWCGVETSTKVPYWSNSRAGVHAAIGSFRPDRCIPCAFAHRKLTARGRGGRALEPSRRSAPPCQTTDVAARTAYEKIWDDHAIGDDLLYVDLHLVHEVTSPQAF